VSPFKIQEITARNWRVDNSKMVRELNFKPQYTLESGIKEALIEDGFIK
jgi:nucleoside-diphosphate-sugar epimerase